MKNTVQNIHTATPTSLAKKKKKKKETHERLSTKHGQKKQFKVNDKG